MVMSNLIIQREDCEKYRFIEISGEILGRRKIWTQDESEEIVKMRRRVAFIGMMRASVILLIIMNSFFPGTFAQVRNLLLLVEFLLLWIKSPFSTSRIPRSETISLLGLVFRMPHVSHFSKYVSYVTKDIVYHAGS